MKASVFISRWKYVINLFLFFFSLFIVSAQTPDKMSYQAVIRDSENQLLKNSTVGMRISILQGSVTGAEVYTETLWVQTNENGLLSAEFGGIDFETIDWSVGLFFLKTETDPEGGSNFSIVGVSQLLSVPFALHAKTAEKLNVPATETDPVYGTSLAASITDVDTARWNKHTQIMGEVDPQFNKSVASGIVSEDINSWSNKQEQLDGNELIFKDWDKNQSDDFDGNYNSLEGRPTKLGDFTNDVGYITNSNDADADSKNEIQDLQLKEHILKITLKGAATEIDLKPYLDDTDTKLTETDVDAMVANNGYRLAFDDKDTLSTNELQVLSIRNDTVFLSDGGFVKLPATTTSLDKAYRTGNTIVADTGAFTVSGTDGIISTGIIGSGDSLKLAGEGTRLIWYPRKAAFRAGFVSDSKWNHDRIGNYSVAFGYETEARGAYSVTMGNNSKAILSKSIAIGFDNLAYKGGAIAIGHKSTAFGTNSIAFGFNTYAEADSSMAIGNNTTSSGKYSTAMGYATTSSGKYSTAMGYNTTVSGDYSTVMGYNTDASGFYSTAFGNQTTASGLVSTALGYKNYAIGQYTTAMGRGTKAEGLNSMAMGYATRASGDFSTAMGSNVVVSGEGSFIIGDCSDRQIVQLVGMNQFTTIFNNGHHFMANNPNYVATFENRNKGDGDGIKIKLGKTATKKDLQEVDNRIKEYMDGDFYENNSVNKLKGLLDGTMNGADLAFLGEMQMVTEEELATLTFAVKKLLITVGNELIEYINDNVPEGLGIDIPTFAEISSTMPGFFPSLVLSDLHVSNPLDRENSFICFSDENDFKMGEIRAQSIEDWIMQYLDPVFLYELYATFKGLDKLKAYAEAKKQGKKIAKSYLNIGVEYSSGNGDYAEWLERLNPDEFIGTGDIVGVCGGKITKDLTNAEQVMAVSHRPIVLGNMPPEGESHLGNNIAFMGQIPVKIMGAVNSGDYIVGNSNILGYGKAVSPQDMTIDDFKLVVGRSWDANLDEGPKMVNTVVGVHNGDYLNILKRYENRFEESENRIDALEKKMELFTGKLTSEK